ncbi:MAG: ATP-dependent helicase HrpB [Bacteroidota bacterium]
MPASLPIESVLPALREALRAHPSAVLQAPPGAGKTTRVPLALLGEDWLGGQKVVMLEPRRLAARAAAHRMAQTLGETVGETVGYRVRLDTKVGRQTRIEVVTEGVLTRMLQSDPSLSGVGLVVFDEFHERNLPSDLGLAFALETQEALRPALRLLVMSATLDGARVAALLGDAPLLTSEGRAYPVETYTLDRMPEPHWRIDGHVAAAVRQALAEHKPAPAEAGGDVLVFLPGAGEIRRAEQTLSDLPAGVTVAPLYGNLPQDAQDRAIAPSPDGERKVVLSTPIAETSLTIEGVRVVIDSGLARAPRFDPSSGMTRLETVRISNASADQRRGRAGRLGPGVCYRLWTPPVQASLAEHTPPEVLTTDLAPLALELAAWGVRDPAGLRWLDPPPEAAFDAARDLLANLGALDRGSITAHGRAMAALGLHPRLAHLVLRGRDLGLGATACDLAALLSERDLFKPSGSHPPPADLRLRLDLLAGEDDGTEFSQGYAVSRGAVHRARQEATHWRKRLGIGSQDRDADAAGLLLAFAYPDRIAQRRPDAETRYRLRNGRAAVLAESQVLAGSDYLVAAHLDGRRAEARIFLAAPVTQQEIERHFAEQIETDEAVTWDAEAGRVRARRQTRIGAVVLRDARLRDPDPQAVAAALLDGVRAKGLAMLPWSKEATKLRERLRFLHHLDAGAWPDVSDAALLADLDAWLGPHLTGGRTGLGHLDLAHLLLGLAGWNRRADIDRLAPTHVTVPSGSNVPIDYSEPEAPVLAVRLQEVFGLTDTPRVGGGRVALTVHLLSPAHRPVQVTQDLASFWRDAYFDVRKDLRGRYSKHPWPDDPLSATPTNRAKRRR